MTTLPPLPALPPAEVQEWSASWITLRGEGWTRETVEKYASDYALAAIEAQGVPDANTEFNLAIDFAIEQGFDAALFLRCWREGDTSEWPEFPHMLAAAPTEKPAQTTALTPAQRRELIDRAGDITDGLNQDDFADEIINQVIAAIKTGASNG